MTLAAVVVYNEGMTSFDDLMTSEQVAAELGVSVRRVQALTRRLTRPLPAIRFGRHFRYDRNEVMAWKEDWETRKTGGRFRKEPLDKSL